MARGATLPAKYGPVCGGDDSALGVGCEGRSEGVAVGTACKVGIRAHGLVHVVSLVCAAAKPEEFDGHAAIAGEHNVTALRLGCVLD
eukprot:1729258-Prymnesium_polylepis.1